MGRIITITGGKVSNVGTKKAIAAVAPRVYQNQNVGADTWAETGKEVRVKSSWAHSIRYDKPRRRLFITFRSGVTCRYDNIGTLLAKNLYGAASIGKHIHRYIKGRPYTISTD